MDKVFGRVYLPSGATIGGISIDSVLEMGETMHNTESSLYDMVGDIAIEAQLIIDLANRVKELEIFHAQEVPQEQTPSESSES